MSASVLNLDAIRSFDRGHRQGHWSRHCCPFCGSYKPVDFAHRSLSLDPRTGYYRCFRCDSKGRLGDFVKLSEIDWQKINREREDEKRRKQRAVTHLLERLAPIEGRAADYLRGRGIDPDFAGEAGCAFLHNYLNKDGKASRDAIIFPIRDFSGQICALQGRYIDDLLPKTKTIGNNQEGLFETPGAFDSPALFIAESPLDALSLHLLGFPAVSVQGTSLSNRIVEECNQVMFDQTGNVAKRIVYICTDNDEPGEKAAIRWHNALLKQGIESKRYKPEVPGWDWNDQLLATL